MASDSVIFMPVESDQNITTIREFRKILQSSVGPAGSSKLLVTGGGYLELTSCSATLLDRLELESPLCQYISHTAKNFPDHGLYFGIAVSHLVEQLWADEGVRKYRVLSITNSLIQTLKKLLYLEDVCIKVDFSTINCFLPLVRTVISSKNSALCAGLDIESFSLEIVRVFINCIDERSNSVGRIHVKVENGPNQYSSYNGLLYQPTESHDLEIVKMIEGEIKVLVFTLKLENDYEKGFGSIVNEIIKILEMAINLNVKLVACQKTVAAEIKLYLMRNKVVLLERIGTDFTSMLVHMTQAFPVSQLPIDPSHVDKLTGYLSAVRVVEFNESAHLLLQSNNMSVGTLLVQSNSLAGPDHFKMLAMQALGSLRSLAAHPGLTVGGGCLEIWLIVQLHLLKESQTDKEYRKVLLWVQQAFLSACGTVPPNLVDSLYHHGWTEEHLRCRCGLVTEAMLRHGGGQLIPVCEALNSQSGLRLNPPRQFNPVIEANVLVESHHQKQNVILSVIETFANLSDIGVIVYKN